MKGIRNSVLIAVMILSLVSTAFAAGPGSAGTNTSQPSTQQTQPKAPDDSTMQQPGQQPAGSTTQQPGQQPADSTERKPGETGKPSEYGKPAETGRPADPAAKAKEVIAGQIEKLASILPEEARAIEALEISFKAITDSLVQSGVAKDEKEAEAQVESVIESKRAVGKGGKTELDILAHLKEKQGKLEQAESVMQDRVKAAPTDIFGYKALGKLREKLGTDKGIEAFVGGKEVPFDVRPLIKEGRTLVPVRAIVETLSAQVSWNPNTRSVTINVGGKTIVLTIDSRTVTLDGKQVTIDIPAEIIDGRTVLPLRFVAEALGIKVDWEGETQTIIMNQQEGQQ